MTEGAIACAEAAYTIASHVLAIAEYREDKRRLQLEIYLNHREHVKQVDVCDKLRNELDEARDEMTRNGNMAQIVQLKRDLERAKTEAQSRQGVSAYLDKVLEEKKQLERELASIQLELDNRSKVSERITKESVSNKTNEKTLHSEIVTLTTQLGKQRDIAEKARLEIANREKAFDARLKVLEQRLENERRKTTRKSSGMKEVAPTRKRTLLAGNRQPPANQAPALLSPLKFQPSPPKQEIGKNQAPQKQQPPKQQTHHAKSTFSMTPFLMKTTAADEAVPSPVTAPNLQQPPTAPMTFKAPPTTSEIVSYAALSPIHAPNQLPINEDDDFGHAETTTTAKPVMRKKRRKLGGPKATTSIDLQSTDLLFEMDMPMTGTKSSSFFGGGGGGGGLRQEISPAKRRSEAANVVKAGFFI